MFSCCCFTSEGRIKAIFFVHFTLFFIFLALNYKERTSELLYLLSGSFLLVSLFGALCTKSRVHHLAHLAGLIDLGSIAVDLLLFWPQTTTPNYLLRPDWLPFYLNLLLRLPFAVILLRISPNGSSSEEGDKNCTASSAVQLKNKRSILSEDEDLESSGGDKNNNKPSSCFNYSSKDDEANSEPSTRLLLSNKSTEV